MVREEHLVIAMDASSGVLMSYVSLLPVAKVMD